MKRRTKGKKIAEEGRGANVKKKNLTTWIEGSDRSSSGMDALNDTASKHRWLFRATPKRHSAGLILKEKRVLQLFREIKKEEDDKWPQRGSSAVPAWGLLGLRDAYE